MAFCPTRSGPAFNCPCFDISVGETDCTITTDLIPLFDVVVAVSLICHVIVFFIALFLLIKLFMNAKLAKRSPFNLKSITISLILVAGVFRILFWSIDPRNSVGYLNSIIADLMYAVAPVLWMCCFVTMLVIWLDAVSSVDTTAPLRGHVRLWRFILFGVNALIVICVVPVQIWGAVQRNNVSLFIFGIGVGIGMVLCLVVSAYYAVKLRKIISDSHTSSGFVEYVRKVTRGIFIVDVLIVLIIILTIFAILFTLPVPALIIQFVQSIIESTAVATVLWIISARLSTTKNSSGSKERHSVQVHSVNTHQIDQQKQKQPQQQQQQNQQTQSTRISTNENIKTSNEINVKQTNSNSASDSNHVPPMSTNIESITTATTTTITTSPIIETTTVIPIAKDLEKDQNHENQESEKEQSNETEQTETKKEIDV